jgi:predicted acetyltransferase
VRPSTALLPSCLAFIDAMRAAGETIWPNRCPDPGESNEAFITRLLALEQATPPAVAQTVHWAVLDDTVVGFITLRHALTAKTALFGGHVGYEVHPGFRGRGVATSMLRLLLRTAPARRLSRLLVTCDPQNVASRKTIEHNGGVLDGVVYVDDVQRETCRFWIDVTAA